MGLSQKKEKKEGFQMQNGVQAFQEDGTEQAMPRQRGRRSDVWGRWRNSDSLEGTQHSVVGEDTGEYMGRTVKDLGKF